MSITKKYLLKKLSTSEKESPWYLSNKVLYDMCRKYRYRRDEKSLIARSLIIGRVYSASLERASGKEVNGDDFYRLDVARTFKKYKLPVVKGEYDLKFMIVEHKKLLDHISRRLGSGARRSFASKYLHFHFPNHFMIFDSRAKKALSYLDKKFKRELELVDFRKEIVDEIQDWGKDREYANFAIKADRLYRALTLSLRKKISLRMFDSMLIDVANKLGNGSSSDSR